MSTINNDYQNIKQDLIAFINQPSSTDEEFNTLALKVFIFQYEYNQSFRKFCRNRRVSPRTIKNFKEIPPVPVDAFKAATLSCYPIDEIGATFMTSGTTSPELKGKNYHRDLEIYDLSMKTFFKQSILPDVQKIKMFILFPQEEFMPNSSLAHYLNLARENYGTVDSFYAFKKDELQMDKLIQELQMAEKSDEPVLLIGATFSFIHLVDECKKRNLQFQLPDKSRVMDTGGSKGRSREVDSNLFKEEMSQLFSIPQENGRNMYGMTELSSQFYDDGNSMIKRAPHWVKTIVVDSEQLEEKEQGEKGIIAHYDLANINSVMAILTEDMGIKEEDGFNLLGRAKGAEAKGCSLAVEQFLSSSKE